MSGYSHRLFDRADSVREAEWAAVCYPALSEAGHDPFMELAFLRAVEESMSTTARTWALIIVDDDGRATCAFLTLYRVNGVVLAGPLRQRICATIRKVFPGYMYFNILMCGLPVSAGQSSLRMRCDTDPAKVVVALDGALCELAQKHGVRILLAKEFNADDCQRLESLAEHGYLRADSLSINLFDPSFASFDEFRAALNHDYRKQFNKSARKFAAADLRTEIITDPARILALYTPAVHALYEAVERQAHHRFEQLPAEFFRALVRQFPGEVTLVVAWRGEQVVGFLWDVMHRGVFVNLFICIDYAINQEVDLYFNLMMQNLDYCRQQRPTRVFVGQTADGFKSRLGCYQRPRYYFVKARGRLLSAIVRLMRRVLFPPAPPPQPRPHMFKQRSTSGQGVAAAARDETPKRASPQG